MKQFDEFERKLGRLQKWGAKCDRLIERELKGLEGLFQRSLAEIEAEKKQAQEVLGAQEIQLQNEIDAAGKEYTRRKYQFERDIAAHRSEIESSERDYHELQKKYTQDLARLNEEKINLQISYDRQRSALNDLYNEKRRSLSVTRTALTGEWQTGQQKMKDVKGRYESEMQKIQEEGRVKITHLEEQATAKRNGWAIALSAMHKELEALSAEKAHLEKRLSDIKSEKEKELESVQTTMAVARQQLDIDKATLIEKAEEDQRRCEAEILDLRKNIETSEKELQDFVSHHDAMKKDVEDGYSREEQMLKESVRNEGEKRDLEQKIYEQEKSQREKEVAHIQEDYEKKKWHWDNQIRTLMMQKSLKDSEHDAERMRVDREARTALRSLEAKRDELKQRLAELKARHEALKANSQKEHDLIQQRWNWRRERLWALWQNRLDVLRKERSALQEQIEALKQQFQKKHTELGDAENREGKRVEDLQSFLLQMGEKNDAQRKNKEIQIELEKTRLLAQIKECEALVTDWTDKIKETQQEVSKNNASTAESLGFLDRWYKEEETETQLFLANLQRAMSSIQSLLERIDVKHAA